MSRLYPEYHEVEPLFREYCLTRDDKLRAKLTVLHDSIPCSLAGKFCNNDADLFDELCQEGRVNLIRVVERFDPDKGVKFSTYASSFIVGCFKHYFRDKKVIKIPIKLRELNSQATKESNRLAQILGREPTLGEISCCIGCEEEKVIAASEATRLTNLASLDAKLSDEANSDSRSDLVGKTDQDLEAVGQFDDLKVALSALNDREKALIHLRFFDGLSQTQTGQEIGLSEGYIRKLEKVVLKKLRELLSSDSSLIKAINKELAEEKPDLRVFGPAIAVPQYKGSVKPFPIRLSQLLVLLECWPMLSPEIPKPIYRTGNIQSWSDCIFFGAVWRLCVDEGTLIKVDHGSYLKAKSVIKFMGDSHLTIGGATFLKGGIYCLDEVTEFLKVNQCYPSLNCVAEQCGGTGAVNITLSELRVALAIYGYLSHNEPRPILRTTIARRLGVNWHSVDRAMIYLAKKGIIIRSQKGKFVRGYAIVKYTSQFKTVFIGGLAFQSGRSYDLNALAREETSDLPELTFAQIKVAVLAYSLLPENCQGSIPYDYLGSNFKSAFHKISFYLRSLQSQGFMNANPCSNWWERGEIDRFVARTESKGALLFKIARLKRGGVYSLRRLCERFAKTPEGRKFIDESPGQIGREGMKPADTPHVFELFPRELAAVLLACLYLPDKKPHPVKLPKSIGSIIESADRHPSVVLSWYIKHTQPAILKRMGKGIYVRQGDLVRLKRAAINHRIILPVKEGVVYELDDLLQQLRAVMNKNKRSTDNTVQHDIP